MNKENKNSNNNNNIALISDTHFGSKSANRGVWNTQLDFFEKQFFPYLLENNIKHVIHGGDLVHNRDSIDLFILQEMKTRFFKWFEENQITIHILVGNHDSKFKNTLDYNFLEENLNEFAYVKKYSKPSVIKIDKYTIGMIPWMIEDIDFPKADILVGHFDVVGMQMIKNICSNEGLDISRFKNFKYVFSGHYHIKSSKDNLHYIGTQYQLSWNDFDEEKGFYVLGENYKLEFIHNSVSPKYVKIYYTETDDKVELRCLGLDKKETITEKKAVSIVKNNYVKLITNKVNNQSKLDNFWNSLQLNSYNGNKIEIIDSSEIIESIDDIYDMDMETDIFEISKNYIETMTFDETINKDKLFDLMKLLYAQSIYELQYNEFEQESY